MEREREWSGEGGRWRQERSITINQLYGQMYTREANIQTSTDHCIVRILLDSTCLDNQQKFTLRVGYIKTIALHKQ